MDIASLAADTARALEPVLPVLIFIGTESAKAVVKKTTDAALEAGKALWAKLKPHAPEGSALANAATDVAANPGNPRPVTALEWELEKLFKANPQLAQEISGVIGSVQTHSETANASGTGSIAITGGMHGGTASTHVNQ